MEDWAGCEQKGKVVTRLCCPGTAVGRWWPPGARLRLQTRTRSVYLFLCVSVGQGLAHGGELPHGRWGTRRTPAGTQRWGLREAWRAWEASSAEQVRPGSSSCG